MRRRPPPADAVPAELLDRWLWPELADWFAARDEWVEAGNVWPGGENARWQEEFVELVAAPDEPWDGTGY